MKDFVGKCVVITGASGGIGYACAKFFEQRGATVYDLSRSGTSCDNINHIFCDVTDAQSVKEAAAHLAKVTQEIHLLINNAGFGISGAIEDTPLEKAKAQFDVNFFGAVMVTNALLPQIKKVKGKIICVSSVAAALPIPFQAFYSASKSAVNAYAMALANELRPFGVGVCALMPGDTKTSFTQNRQKQTASAQYSTRSEKSVAQMEKDEQEGGSPLLVAKKIYRIAQKNKIKPLYTVGAKYNFFVFLSKVLGSAAVNKILGKMYSR